MPHGHIPAKHGAHTIDMQSACTDAQSMSTTIQIRDVPEEVHRRLKAKAALAGLSLSQYMLREARRIADVPTHEEMRRRLRQLPRRPDLDVSIAELIREDRASR